MLTTGRDNMNMLNIQHITPKSKGWDYSDTPVGGNKNSHLRMADPAAA